LLQNDHHNNFLLCFFSPYFILSLSLSLSLFFFFFFFGVFLLSPCYEGGRCRAYLVNFKTLYFLYHISHFPIIFFNFSLKFFFFFDLFSTLYHINNLLLSFGQESRDSNYSHVTTHAEGFWQL
jgi:hypothetical protein